MHEERRAYIEYLLENGKRIKQKYKGMWIGIFKNNLIVGNSFEEVHKILELKYPFSSFVYIHRIDHSFNRELKRVKSEYEKMKQLGDIDF